jgi:hypothetical protein
MVAIVVGGGAFQELPKDAQEKISSQQRSFFHRLSKLIKSLFSVGLYDVHQAAQFRKELKATYHPRLARETDDERISVIRNSLILMQGKSIEELKNRVGIPEQSQIHQRMRSIEQRLSDQNEGVRNHALKEGERLMHSLRSRANKKLGIEIVKTALKITAVVVSILLIFSPLSPLLLAIFGGAVAVGGTVSIYKRKKIGKEHFVLSEYERQGLELLSKAIIRKELESKPEKKKKGQKEEAPIQDAPLSPSEQKQLTDFLSYAKANTKLNARLQNIREPSLAETFLVKFSHKTKSMDTFQRALEKANRFLKHDIPKTLVQHEQTMETLTATLQTKLQACIQHEKGPCQKLKTVKLPDTPKLQHVQALLAQMDEKMARIAALERDFMYLNPYDTEHASSWHEKTHLLLESARDTVNKAVQEITSMLPKKAKRGKKTPEVEGLTKDDIKTLRKQKDLLVAIRDDMKSRIASIDRDFERMKTMNQEIQTMVQKLPEIIQKPFSLSELYTLDTFKKLGETCPYHRAMPILKTLYDQCNQAKDVLEQLNCIFQCSSGYKPGDIIFLDETFKAKFEGKPAFSAKGMWKKGVFWKELAQIPKKGPFTVQPFFTGSLTHAAMINVQENMFCACEIVDKFANSDILFAEAAYSRAFTPNFKKIVTQEGIKKLREFYPGKSEQAIFEELRLRFEGAVSKLVHDEKDRLKDIQLAHWKAGVAILPRFTRQVRSVEQQKAVQVEEQMFCSEFVSMMMTSAFTRVEESLLQEMGLERPRTLFHEIIPKDVPYEKVHPNRLENFLKAYFTQTPTPAVVRALVQERSQG